MYSYQDQFSAATKTHVQAQMDLISALTTKTFEGMEKIIELNLNATKATLEESSAAARQFAAVKDPQELLALAQSQAQPTAEKAAAYGRHLAGILSSMQAELTKTAENQVAETSRKVSALVDEIAKNAPAGSENAVALMKSAIGNANASYEQLTKNTKQAVETMEGHMNNAARQFTQAAEKTVGRGKK